MKEKRKKPFCLFFNKKYESYVTKIILFEITFLSVTFSTYWVTFVLHNFPNHAVSPVIFHYWFYKTLYIDLVKKGFFINKFLQ